MNDFDIKGLELDKILNKLSDFAAMDDAKNRLRELSPCGSFEKSKRMMSETFGAYEMAMKFGAPTFRNIPNSSDGVRRAGMGASLSLSELLSAAHGLRQMRELKAYRSRCESYTGVLDGYFEALYTDLSLENRIFSSILSPEEVADDASPELRSIRRNINRVAEGIKDSLDSIIRSPAYQKYLQDPIITMRDSRFVVPVKSEFRTQVSGLVHDMSSSGATVFVEPMAVVEANNQIRVLRSQEKAEIERIVAEISALVGEGGEEFASGFGAMVSLNVFFAKAEYGIDGKAFFPTLTKDGVVDLKKARHPLIDKKKVVPIDIAIGKGYSTLVITGPNTGGKTVCLKTVGLLCQMAQCGLMIPAEEGSVISVFRSVLADIGDEQSIEQSLSTFSGHMKKIVEIMDRADPDTLVLLDELGAGTDPVEGAALAVAIIEYLKSKGSRIVATTHYAEIKVYALEHGDVENASCEFDIETLRPTYRLIMGIPGRSNAFAISGRLGLKEEIIHSAKQHLSARESSFERVVESLNEQKKKLDDQLVESARLKEEALKIRQGAQKERDRVKSLWDTEMEKAKTVAQRIIADVKADAEKIWDELEQLKKIQSEGEVAAAAQRARALLKSDLAKLEDSADPVAADIDDDYTLPRPLKVGDEVLIASLGKRGTVSAVDDSTVTVSMGVVKTKVPLGSIRLVEGAKKAKPLAQVRTGITKVNRDVSTTVDVRGMNGEEAMMEVDRFIDNCVITGVETATIIHGVGTGVLKNTLRRYFKKHKSIAAFRPGTYGEGEDGVTIVEIK